jgi:AAA15 family ATPase/GTPase
LIPAPKQKDHEQNIILTNKYRALNAMALYGANAGGKSNILNAMSLLGKIVNISARTSSTTKLPHDPFLLREGWSNKATVFEILFVIDDKRYRYGFAFTAEAIKQEWLFRKSASREVSLFEREEDVIDVSSGFNGTKKILDAAIEATRTNALFLSICDMLNVEEAKLIMKWFRHFNMIDGLNTEIEELKTVQLWQKEGYREKIKQYLSSVCLNIEDIDVATKSFDESDLPMEMSDNMKNRLTRQLQGSQGYAFFAKHRVYDSKKGTDRKDCQLEMGRKRICRSKKSASFEWPCSMGISQRRSFNY